MFASSSWPHPIAGYAMVGDRSTAALVSLDGSIDWLCLPSFDSPACFAAILGGPEHGRWRLAPRDAISTERQYVPGTLVLETTYRTATGTVRVTEAMPAGDEVADVLRVVEGLDGETLMEQELIVRFDYGLSAPWVRRLDLDGEEAITMVAGPDRLVLRAAVLPKADGHAHRSTFTVGAGERMEFNLRWQHSWREIEPAIDTAGALDATVAASREWVADLQYAGPWREAVERSVLVLRGLTDEATGGIIAAPTTSLPEDPGGERNWDYRYTWLRDASLTVDALVAVGLHDRIHLWRDWLLRAIAGDPANMQIMYRVDGGRDLPERILEHLPGYGGAAPVRIGNGAVGQRQHDVLGQMMLTLRRLRTVNTEDAAESWIMQRALLGDLEHHWQEPDQGLWEMRGKPQRFTHSLAMMWAAFDCGIRAVEEEGLPGETDRWREIRDALYDEVMGPGFSDATGSFRQHADTDEVDASLLQLPTIGIIAGDDPRFLGTIARIEQDLVQQGIPLRYRTTGLDGLGGSEHPFVLCGFWLVVAYAQAGRVADARTLMEQLLSLRNDVGLLAEEVNPSTGEFWGNAPQAFSHLGLVLAAAAIDGAEE